MLLLLCCAEFYDCENTKKTTSTAAKTHTLCKHAGTHKHTHTNTRNASRRGDDDNRTTTKINMCIYRAFNRYLQITTNTRAPNRSDRRRELNRTVSVVCVCVCVDAKRGDGNDGVERLSRRRSTNSWCVCVCVIALTPPHAKSTQIHIHKHRCNSHTKPLCRRLGRRR